jgi:hypothetical protein
VEGTFVRIVGQDTGAISEFHFVLLHFVN